MKREIIFGIIILLISTSVIPVFSGNATEQIKEKNIGSASLLTPEKTTSLSFYVFGKTKLEKHDVVVSSQDATQIYTQLQELNKELAAHPFSEKTRQLKQEFFNLLEEKNVIPAGVSQEELMSLLQPSMTPPHNSLKSLLPFEGKASEWRCSFVSSGTGSMVPIIILPRLIPILLTPIPRVLIRWNVKEGLTSCGGLYSGTGFIAYGEQKGFAVGFWGIGLTFSLPPIMNVYGLAGYAFYASVNADEIEHYPPNNPPEITQTDPVDGQQMVPISTSELRFSIKDDDGDLMSYTVTTNPDIGSGSGGLKPDGVYSIPISGLESLTTYTCHIQLTDGKDSTEKTVTFTTEPVAPIISNPSPADGEHHVPTDTQLLQFTLKDFQGDAMDYTVQTSPNIGSGSGVGVHDGTYTVAISGLLNSTAYHWYVNATDGEHWTRKTFSFQTGFPTHFDPFEKGWHYRKQITIDHTNISEDLTNFPVLVSTVDIDLKEKAQPNGDDILFMNNTGFATCLNYEIEQYDGTLGKLIAWVNITQLSSTEDTTFYMYYGNPTCLSQQNPEKTWDSSYIGVLHMNDATASTIVDSTSNARIGMKKAANEPIAATAQIGKGQTFDGSDDYIQFSSTIIGTGVKSWSFWANTTMTAPSGGFAGLLGNALNGGSNDKGFCSAIGGTWPDMNFEIGNTVTAGHFLTIGIDIPDSNLHYYTAVYDGTDLKAYRDGSYVAMDNTKDGTEAAGDYNFMVGRSNIGGGSYYFHGTLDEIRVSNIAKSANWISTEYVNQNDPTGFLFIGPEEPGP